MNSMKCSLLKRMLLKPGNEALKGLTDWSVVEGLFRNQMQRIAASPHMAGQQHPAPLCCSGEQTHNPCQHNSELR